MWAADRVFALVLTLALLPAAGFAATTDQPTFQAFALPDQCIPQHITPGPGLVHGETVINGAMWFVAACPTGPLTGKSVLYRMALDGTLLAPYPVNTYPYNGGVAENERGLTLGPDGKTMWLLTAQSASASWELWGFDVDGSRISRTELKGVDQNTVVEPTALIAGPGSESTVLHGSTNIVLGDLWFIDGPVPQQPGWPPGHIWRIPMKNGSAPGEPVPYEMVGAKGSGSSSLTIGPNGNLWFPFNVNGEKAVEAGVGYITPAGVHGQLFKLPEFLELYDIAAGPDGAVWITAQYVPQVPLVGHPEIARVASNGAIQRFLPTTLPGGILTGPDGRLWYNAIPFGNSAGPEEEIGSISPDGKMNTYTGNNMPSCPADWFCSGATTSLAADGNGNLWAGAAWVGNPSGKPPTFKGWLDLIQLPKSPKLKFIPVQMGVSVGNIPNGITGTAGLKVVRTTNPTGPAYILGADHVLGASGAAQNSCPGTALHGNLTGQPGSNDLKSGLADRIAHFVQSWDYRGGVLDAALSQIQPGWTNYVQEHILGIGEPSPTIANAQLGETVVKSGEATGVTVGTIIGTDVTMIVTYAKGCPHVRFYNQIAVQASSPTFFSIPGDSGAAILDVATHQPVGMVISGIGIISFGNSMSTVAARMGITPVGMASSAKPLVDELSADPHYAQLQAAGSRHEDDILALPGVQAIGIARDSNGLAFLAFGPRWTPELARVFPHDIEGVPLHFRELGGEITLQ